MIVKDGDKCPRTQELVIIRSSLGCIGCPFLGGLDGSKKPDLSVNCRYNGGVKEKEGQAPQ